MAFSSGRIFLGKTSFTSPNGIFTSRTSDSSDSNSLNYFQVTQAVEDVNKKAEEMAAAAEAARVAAEEKKAAAEGNIEEILGWNQQTSQRERQSTNSEQKRNV